MRSQLIKNFFQILWKCLYLGSALALISCSSSNKKKMSKTELYYSQGTVNLMRGEYTGALDKLLKAHKLAPKRSDIANNLGMAYYFKGKQKTAIKYIKKAIKLNPKHSDALNNLGTIYLRSGRFKQAEKYLTRASQDLTYKRADQSFYNLGVLNLKRNKTSKAISFFKKSIKENEYNCGAHFKLGEIEYKDKNFDNALEHFEAGASGTCYGYDAANYFQALTLLKLKKYWRARSKFSDFEDRFPNSKYLADAKRKKLALDAREAKKSELLKDYPQRPGQIITPKKMNEKMAKEGPEKIRVKRLKAPQI